MSLSILFSVSQPMEKKVHYFYPSFFCLNLIRFLYKNQKDPKKENPNTCVHIYNLRVYMLG